MQFLTERHSGKTKQLQTGQIHPLKASLSFSVLKLFYMNLELSKEKLKKKPIPILFILLNIFRLPRTITSDIVFRFCVGLDAQFHRLCYKTIGSCFCCALSSYGALGKFGEHSRS